MKIENIIKHFIKICKHKHYVRQYCWKVGLYRQGLTHDLSKFSPTEFIESVKYYQGDSSPIDACKKENGYSKAWLHHKGRNPHHYEYWQDNFDKGGEALPVPYEYTAEMLCDYLGAAKAYMGKSFSYTAELNWWKKNKLSKPIAMHPNTKDFISQILTELTLEPENKVLNKHHFKAIYKAINRKD